MSVIADINMAGVPMDDLLKEFITEASESIVALDSALVQIERNPDDPALLSEIFRVVHTIKGTCGFLNLPRLERIAHAAENVLGRFRDGTLVVSQDAIGVVLESVDAIKVLVAAISDNGDEPAGSDEALVQKLNAVVAKTAPTNEALPAAKSLYHRIGGMAVIDAAIETVYGVLLNHPQFGERFGAVDGDLLQEGLRDCASAAVGSPSVTLRISLDEALKKGGLRDVPSALSAAVLQAFDDALKQLEVPEDVRGEAIASVAKSTAPVSVPDPHVQSGDEPRDVTVTDSARDPKPEIAAQSIRVSIDSLEQLMAVVSELVLIRNQLLQTLRQQPESPFAGPLQRLNHVTTELQESVMTTRMQPIGNAWAKLPRLVRDLSVELSKKIVLSTQGAETELDRQVLDLIKDPLTHMIRNAIDHGIEMPEERRAAGKSETGHIALQARHEGGHIVVEIADDGRGLSTAKIRKKAVAAGILPAADAEAASDTKIHQLIFHAGLSTAEKVTSVSGRGVGMDVVRTNIEKIGGTIELNSTEGKGAKFTIRIPLTLTIVSALIVECGGERFAMPQSSVVELVGTAGSSQRAIEYINGAPVLRLRDRLLPLLSLQSLLKLEQTREDYADRCILVTQIGAQTFGIIVDRVFDTEEIVVKPVARILRDIPLFSGNTILGDGDVIMILDPKGIAEALGGIETQAESDETLTADAADCSRMSLLVMRSGGGKWKAVPLSLVARIEEVAPSRVEQVEGRRVIQYRGRLIPLLTIESDDVRAEAAKALRSVLIFEDGNNAMGLEVDDIVDIVESRITAEVESNVPGILGSLVVGDAATDIIDVGHYWAQAVQDAYQPAQKDRARRILLVDPNPFARNLLQPVLVSAGYRVETAASFDDWLTRPCGAEGFDAILADMTMPVPAGRALGEMLAAMRGSRPVIGLFDPAAGAQPKTADPYHAVSAKLDRNKILSLLSSIKTDAA